MSQEARPCTFEALFDEFHEVCHQGGLFGFCLNRADGTKETGVVDSIHLYGVSFDTVEIHVRDVVINRYQQDGQACAPKRYMFTTNEFDIQSVDHNFTLYRNDAEGARSAEDGMTAQLWLQNQVLPLPTRERLNDGRSFVAIPAPA